MNVLQVAAVLTLSATALRPSVGHLGPPREERPGPPTRQPRWGGRPEAFANKTKVRAQQTPPRSVKDGVYAAVQMNRGKTVYTEKCVECHGTMTSATPDMAPLLNDHVFQTTWKDRSLAELFDKIRDTMPPNKAGTLSPQQLVDLIAYILSANALPAGDVPLAEDIETMKQIRFDN